MRTLLPVGGLSGRDINIAYKGKDSLLFESKARKQEETSTAAINWQIEGAPEAVLTCVASCLTHTSN